MGRRPPEEDTMYERLETFLALRQAMYETITYAPAVTAQEQGGDAEGASPQAGHQRLARGMEDFHATHPREDGPCA